MKCLLDASAWISWLRGDQETASRLAAIVDDDERAFVSTGPVRMELLQGAGESEFRLLRETLDLLPNLPVEERDYDFAATIYRTVRARGHTVRASLDCLIAAVALRSEVILVHRDVDFARIASVLPALATIDLTS